MAIILQWISLTYVYFWIMILNAAGIAFFLFVNAIIKDIKLILKPINKNSNTKKRRQQIHKQFVEFIDLHSTIKELSCVFIFDRYE